MHSLFLLPCLPPCLSNAKCHISGMSFPTILDTVFWLCTSYCYYDGIKLASLKACIDCGNASRWVPLGMGEFMAMIGSVNGLGILSLWLYAVKTSKANSHGEIGEGYILLKTLGGVKRTEK